MPTCGSEATRAETRNRILFFGGARLCFLKNTSTYCSIKQKGYMTICYQTPYAMSNSNNSQRDGGQGVPFCS